MRKVSWCYDKETLLAVLMAILMGGCVGYQNVSTYQRVEGEMVKVKQVKAYIFGTSGQAIKDADISIEKKDAVDSVVGLVKDGVAAGLSIAKGTAEIVK